MSTSEIAKLEARWRENRQSRLFTPVAEGYRKLQDFERCLEVVQAGLEDHPDHAPGYIVLGRCQLDVGNEAAAVEAFERVLELDEENVIALRFLANIAEQRGEFEKAAARLREMLAVDPGNRDAAEQLERIEVARAGETEDEDKRPDAAIAERTDAQADGDAGDEALQPVDHGFERSEVLDSSSVEPLPADQAIEVQDNLQPPADVEQLDDLIAEEPASISRAAADSHSMAGLVGKDFAQHREGVKPLDDVERNPSAIQPDGAEALPELETSEDLVLHPSDSSEFQVADASHDLAALDLPPEDELLVATEADESNPFAPDADAAADEQMDTVAASFGADSLGDAPATGDFRQPHEPGQGRRGPPVEHRGDPSPANRSAHGEPPSEELSGDASDDADDEALYAPPEPELVVTQSMAELYLKQGHHADALAVYRLLYQQHPNDLRLREKVDELETASAQGSERGSDDSQRAASVTARHPGESVASLFGALLRARLGGGASAPAEAPRAEGEGTPTRPAEDHLSLSAVFGEESSPVPPAAGQSSAPESEDGVTFDDFFGGDTAAAGSRPRAARREDDDLDQFHSWLQNLKR